MRSASMYACSAKYFATAIWSLVSYRPSCLYTLFLNVFPRLAVPRASTYIFHKHTTTSACSVTHVDDDVAERRDEVRVPVEGKGLLDELRAGAGVDAQKHRVRRAGRLVKAFGGEARNIKLCKARNERRSLILNANDVPYSPTLTFM